MKDKRLHKRLPLVPRMWILFQKQANPFEGCFVINNHDLETQATCSTLNGKLESSNKEAGSKQGQHGPTTVTTTAFPSVANMSLRIANCKYKSLVKKKKDYCWLNVIVYKVAITTGHADAVKKNL